jgi:KUP system potassium uptake protein
MDRVRLEVRENATEFIARIKAESPFRIAGTAVVMGRMTQGVPLPLTLNLKFNHVLHERMLLVAIQITETPRVANENRAVVSPITDHVTRVELRFGFMEKVNVPQGLACAVERGQIPPCELHQVTYYTGHETVIPLGLRHDMARWRESVFALMHRNAQRPGAYFQIPTAQLMEIGVEFEI